MDSKMYARNPDFPNDWVRAIDYYNSFGGKNVQLFISLEEGSNHRVLGISDTGNVLLLNQENEVESEDYTKVYESRKRFFYNEEIPNLVEAELPNGETFLDDSHISYYV